MAGVISYASTYCSYTYSSISAHVLLLAGGLLPAPVVEDQDLTGKVAIVTGGNSGIGLSIATSLARANATVYLACRDVRKGQEAAAEIVDILSNGDGSSKHVHVVELDTSSLKSVHSFAAAWARGGNDSSSSTRKIDIIIHNAGIAGALPGKKVTDEKLGTMYATNYAGPFLLTSLLEKQLASDARVVLTSSAASFNGKLLNMVTFPRYLPQPGDKLRNYSSVYADTKLMQIVFAKMLQERWKEQALTDGNTRIAHAFSPGYTQSNMIARFDELPTFDPVWWALKAAKAFATPIEVGASTGYWLASTTATAVTDPANGGRYWERLEPWTSGADLLEAKYGQGFFTRLWDLWTIDTGAQWD